MADPACVANVVGILAAAFPDVAVTEQTIAVYASALADVPGDQLLLAAQKHLSSSRYFPRVAELRESALSVSGVLPDTAAETAWGDVLEAISRFGWNRKPVFADPLVERALQCTVGWQDLCTSDLEQGPMHRARFVAAYQALQKSQRAGALLPAALRAQIEQSRKDHLVGTLDDQWPDRAAVSDQQRRARELVERVGDGGAAQTPSAQVRHVAEARTT